MFVRKKYHGRRLQQRALQGANLRQSYVLRLVDSLATTTMAFVVPLMVYNITHNIAWSGASFTLEWLPRLTAIPAAGPLVDRLGAPRFFVIADGLRAAIVAGAAVWIWQDPRSWLIVVGMAVLAGMLAQSTFVAAEKLGVEVTGNQPLHRVQAVQVGIDQIVQVLGPVVGGVLLAINATLALGGIVALLIMSIGISWRLNKALPITSSVSTHRPSVLAGFRAGLRVIGEHRSLVHVMIGTALFNLLLALLLTVTPAIVEQRFHRGTASVSLLWSLAAGASVLAVGIASRAAQRFGITAVGIVSGVVACVACLVAGMTHNYWTYVYCLMIFLAMDASYAVFIRTARARIVPRAVYGTTVGVIVLLTLSSYPLAGVLVAVVPFRFISQLIVGCTTITALLSCWSFAAMDHKTLNGREAKESKTYALEGA